MLTINKIADHLARQLRSSSQDARKAVQALLDTLRKTLSQGEKITLPGFGTFSVTERAARARRNPRTGEVMQSPASKAVRFQPGKHLKAAVQAAPMQAAPVQAAPVETPSAPPSPHVVPETTITLPPALAELTRNADGADSRYLAEPAYPYTWISQGWDQGYQITGLMGCSDHWGVVMRRNAGLGWQWWEAAERFPETWIALRWQEGYQITGLSHRDGLWVVVMSQAMGYGDQIWMADGTFPVAWVQDQWRRGYQITNLGGGPERWVVVASRDAGFADQCWVTDRDYPAAWIAERRAAGFKITDLDQRAGQWAVVMSK